MMIARLYTGCHDIISIRNAYHGNAAGTMGATAQCNYKFNVVQVYFPLKQVSLSFCLRDQCQRCYCHLIYHWTCIYTFKVHPVLTKEAWV